MAAKTKEFHTLQIHAVADTAKTYAALLPLLKKCIEEERCIYSEMDAKNSAVAYHTQTADKFLEYWLMYAHVCLLKRNGEITGFAVLDINDKMATFGPMYVDPKSRGNGYGESMMRRLKAVAIDEGAKLMRLSVINTNPYLEKYVMQGFEPRMVVMDMPL